ncbi:14431_t:CDS:1 [Cetraspora pellucida]|uniref:14431_t:CDS:1 n=1 Tax=Cetraspora pellucida TaxID=1433469 RepID=A0A9N9CQ98_9GLOM|nr:14431_t:CDS:1 [Cetraspora pellucida]
MREFHINEHRVDDIWEDQECQQQIIQSTISTLVPSTSSENFNQIRRETLYPESTTPLNTEIKKRSSKSRSKTVLCNNELCSHISDSIPTNNSTEKISSENLGVLYEKEARRDEKNKANMTCLLATT